MIKEQSAVFNCMRGGSVRQGHDLVSITRMTTLGPDWPIATTGHQYYQFDVT